MKKLLCTAAAVAVLACASPVMANTITASGSTELTFGTTLGAADYGTVNYTFLNGGNTIDFDVVLKSGYEFINSGQAGVFSFTTNIPVSYGSIVSNTIATGWTGLGNGTGTAFHMDGQGDFGGGVTHAGNGGSNPLGTELMFAITGASAITLLQSTGGLGSFFAADVCQSTAGVCTGATGIVGVPAPALGAGLPGLIAACGGLLALARRRRNKLAA